MILVKKEIELRLPQLSDAEDILRWENQEDAIPVSSHEGEFTLQEIREYITGINDVYLDKQIRFVICTQNGRSVGCVDVFDISFEEKVGYVGILVGGETDRRANVGSMALAALTEYCFETLRLKELVAEVQEVNTRSLRFFEKNGFSAGSQNAGIIRYTLNSEQSEHA